MTKALPNSGIILHDENHFLFHLLTILESFGMMEYWNVGIVVKRKPSEDKVSSVS
jgi:hypothetical protein